MAMESPSVRGLRPASERRRRLPGETPSHADAHKRECSYRQRSRAAALIDFIADLIPVELLAQAFGAERSVTETEGLFAPLFERAPQRFFNDLSQADGSRGGESLCLNQKGVGNFQRRLHDPYYRTPEYGYMGSSDSIHRKGFRGWRRMPTLLLRPLHRLAKLRVVDLNVRLYFCDLVLFAAAHPAVGPLVSDLHARYRTVIRIVDLGRDAA